MNSITKVDLSIVLNSQNTLSQFRISILIKSLNITEIPLLLIVIDDFPPQFVFTGISILKSTKRIFQGGILRK